MHGTAGSVPNLFISLYFKNNLFRQMGFLAYFEIFYFFKITREGVINELKIRDVSSTDAAKGSFFVRNNKKSFRFFGHKKCSIQILRNNLKLFRFHGHRVRKSFRFYAPSYCSKPSKYQKNGLFSVGIYSIFNHIHSMFKTKKYSF